MAWSDLEKRPRTDALTDYLETQKEHADEIERVREHVRAWPAPPKPGNHVTADGTPFWVDANLQVWTAASIHTPHLGNIIRKLKQSKHFSASHHWLILEAHRRKLSARALGVSQKWMDEIVESYTEESVTDENGVVEVPLSELVKTRRKNKAQKDIVDRLQGKKKTPFRPPEQRTGLNDLRYDVTPDVGDHDIINYFVDEKTFDREEATLTFLLAENDVLIDLAHRLDIYGMGRALEVPENVYKLVDEIVNRLEKTAKYGGKFSIHLTVEDPTGTAALGTSEEEMNDEALDSEIEAMEERLAAMKAERNSRRGIMGHPTAVMVQEVVPDAGLAIFGVEAMATVKEMVKAFLAEEMPEEWAPMLDSEWGNKVVDILTPIVAHGLATQGWVPFGQDMLLKVSPAALKGNLIIHGVDYTSAFRRFMKNNVQRLMKLKKLAEKFEKFESGMGLLTDGVPDFSELAQELEAEEARVKEKVPAGKKTA